MRNKLNQTRQMPAGSICRLRVTLFDKGKHTRFERQTEGNGSSLHVFRLTRLESNYNGIFCYTANRIFHLIDI